MDKNNYYLEVEDDNGLDLITTKKIVDEAMEKYNEMSEGLNTYLELKEEFKEAITFVKSMEKIEKDFNRDMEKMKDFFENLKKMDIDNLKEELKKMNRSKEDMEKYTKENTEKYKNVINNLSKSYVEKYENTIKKRLSNYLKNMSKGTIIISLLTILSLGANFYMYKSLEKYNEIIGDSKEYVSQLKQFNNYIELLKDYRDFKISVSNRLNSKGEN